MDFGVHLPQMWWGGRSPSLDGLIRYVRAARDLGFAAIGANDHFVFTRPWLDGPVALAAALADAGDMTLATTVGLPVLRGPVAFAKTMATLDLFSGGRLAVGVGPGSFRRDYETVGVRWEERWPRFEEAIRAIRALWGRDGSTFEGRFYSTVGVRLEPAPSRPGGPPLWVGSWGSEAGLRRVARLGDGWLASAYNATPQGFAARLSSLHRALRGAGRDPEGFPNALVTMLFHVTEDRAVSRRVVEDLLAPALDRPWEEVAARSLVGPAEECAEKVVAYRGAGVERVFLWPVGDGVAQLEAFVGRVLPLLPS